jgi:outer membrane receptor for ferrienterochelin and colicins
MNKLLRYLFFISISALSTTLYGQDKDSIFAPSVYEVLNAKATQKEKTLEQLLNISVTSVSKKEEQLSKTPATVIVITAEDIKRRGYSDLTQIFYDLPGFDVSQGNGNDFITIFQRGYRSQNIDRLLMMVDGVEENDMWRGNIWLSRQYPLSNIKRIEIIYGAASTMYGANAFAGVINIITKDANEIAKGKNKIGLAGQVYYGSWNTACVDLTLAGKQNKFFWQVGGRYFTSKEMDFSKYADYDYNLDNGDVNVYNEDYFRKKLGVAKSSADFKTIQDAWKKSPNEVGKLLTYNKDSSFIYPSTLGVETAKRLDKKLSDSVINANNGVIRPDFTQDWLVFGKIRFDNFTVGFERWERNEGQNGWYTEVKRSPAPQSTPWKPNFTHLYFTYTKKLNEQLSFDVLSNYRIHQLDASQPSESNMYALNLRLRDLVKLRAASYNYSSFFVLSKQLRSEARIIYRPNEKLSWITGVEWRNSFIQGDYVKGNVEYPEETGTMSTNFPEGNQFDSNNYAIYSQMNYAFFRNLTFTAGGRLDHNVIRKNGGFGTVFNPRLALVFTPKKFVIKAIYAEAFRDADFWQKYATAEVRKLNNPSLEPEKVRNFDLNIGFYPTKNTYLNLTGYYAFYSGAIGTKVVPYQGTTTTQNQAIGEYRIMGIQAEGIYKLENYLFSINYTYCEPKNTKDLNDKTTDIRIGDIASHRINLDANALFFKHLQLNLRVNYVGERLTGKTTTIVDNPLNSIEAYINTNLTMSYNNFFVKDLTLQAACYNLLDTQYYHPGLRAADGLTYSARIPQPLRNFMAKVIYNF